MTDEDECRAIEYVMNGFNKFAKQCVERGITPERFTSTVTWLLAHDPEHNGGTMGENYIKTLEREGRIAPKNFRPTPPYNGPVGD